MNINKNITPYNRNVKDSRDIKFLVIHAVGAVSTAENNAKYYASKSLNASAHYFCDDNSIWQSVEDKDVAWHCGTAGCYTQKHQTARNANSIGIEMCQDTTTSVSAATIANAAELVLFLMNKYGIPKENVIRHWDVVNKRCPSMYIEDGAWNALKDTLTGTVANNVQQAESAVEVPVVAPAVEVQAVQAAPAASINLHLRDLQGALNADGITDSNGNRLAEDGIWGAKTASAIAKLALSTKTIHKYTNTTAWVQCRVGASIDGLFGNGTKACVINSQGAHGLVQDGIVGKNTIMAILRDMGVNF